MKGPEETSHGRIVSWFRSDLLYAAIALIIVAITALRLVPTYSTFTGTYDEPIHIACGMEWLDKGTYTIEQLHPPLARVAVAIGPYLEGLRSHSLPNDAKEGNAILYSDGNYWKNLMLARLGTLPFLIVACAVILLWARRWFTMLAGLWALLLFVSLPPILGHAALATLDMACAATVIAALYQMMRWLENPNWRRSVVFGITLGLAFLTKFSSLAFLPICFTVAIFYFVLAKRDKFFAHGQLRLRIGQAFITGCVAFVLLWAGYRFNLAPLSPHVGSHPTIDMWVQAGPLIRNAAYRVYELPLPLTKMAKGLYTLYGLNKPGGGSFLLGQYQEKGFWFFFPVVLGLKTPVGFILLAIGGLFAVLWRLRSSPWQHCLTALFPIAILLVCMTSNINLGVRHILAIYPLLALLAGHAISLTFQNRRRRMISVISVLLACTVVLNAWRAHPDYMAYFNQLAGNHPENILCESDLDWGQDLNRLSLRLKSLGVKEVAIGYFGTAPLERANLPQYHILLPNDQKTTGYVAISVRYTTMDYACCGAYGWLKNYVPLERIGKSIDLYRIDK